MHLPHRSYNFNLSKKNVLYKHFFLFYIQSMKETIINLFFNKILNPYHPIFSKVNLDNRFKWISCNMFECRDNNSYFLFYRINESGDLKYISSDFNNQDLFELFIKHGTKDLYLNNNSAMYNFKWGKNAK